MAYRFSDSMLALPVKLNEDEQFVLCMIAYFGRSLQEHSAKNICSWQKISVLRAKEITAMLSRNGIVSIQYPYWEPFGHVFPAYYFTVAFLLMDRHPDWWEFFRGLSVQQDQSRRFEWSVAKAVYTNDPKQISHIHLFPAWGQDYDLYYKDHFFDEEFLPAFAALDPIQMEHLSMLYLEGMLRNESWDDRRMEQFSHIIEYYGQFEPKVKIQLMDMLKAFRFLYYGDIPQWNPRGDTQWSLWVKAVFTLYRGDTEAAGEQFEASLKLHNKTASASTKNFYDNELFDFFLVLYYAKANSAATVKKASQFLNKAPVKNYLDYLPCCMVIQHVMQGCDDSRLAKDLCRYLKALHNQPLPTHLTTLLAHFFKLDDQLVKQKIPINLIPRSPVLRHELSPYLDIDNEAQLEELFGGKPILASMRRKEYWESVIDKLSVSLIENKEKTTDQPSTRFIYIVSEYESMSILSQHILKSGNWSVGSQVSMDKYMRQELEGMDDIDKKIAGASRSYSYYSLYARYAIPQLVGCNRVFYDDRAGRHPVDVVEEKPFVTIEKVKDGFFIKTNVPKASDYGDSSGKVVIRRDSKTRFTVFRLTDFERKAIDALTVLGKFPQRAEPALRQFLEQLSGKIEVHSDLLEGGSSLQKKEGVANLVLRLVPLKELFSLEVQVQPLAGGKLRLVPGLGKEDVFDEADNVRYQVRRDLKTEAAHFAEIKEFLQSELFVDLSVNQASLSVEDLLRLLEFVNDKGDRFVVEWPEDKKLNLKATLTNSSFNMKLTSKENWFEVEGEVKIGNEVVSAMQFLNLISQGIVNDRFVKLNDTDYLALTENLAKYLQRLEGLTQQSHGKSRVPFYQVGALADIVKHSDGGVKSDKGLTSLMKKIDQAAKMEVAVPSQLMARLRDYQVEGFEWMVRLSAWGAGTCLADDMGLGKTVQSIAFMLYKAAEGPSLVVSPASVMLNWANELSRFAPSLDVKILNESANRDAMLSSAKPYDVVLTTYGLLVREEKSLTGIDWNIICLDEAHTIKNRGTKMSAAAMKLKSQSRVILTGTPIQNYLSELWNLFQFLNPGLLGSFDHFTKKYILPIEQDGDKERQKQLKKMITPFLLRRTKAEVIEELPEKTEITRRIELSDAEKAAYETMRMAAEAALQSEDKVDVNTLAQITKLRQAACSISLVQKDWNFESTKITAAADLVEEIIVSGNNVLVFSQFTSYLTMVKTTLERRFGTDKLYYLDGSTTIRKREKMVADFQHGVVPVFLISLKAGGLGLNLTNANYVIHLDPWWNPAVEQQATDRAYRIGQNRNVTVYHLISENTIEEKILRLHKTKRDLADSLLSDSNVSRAMTIEDLRYLVEVED